jgi:hypothetical protein
VSRRQRAVEGVNPANVEGLPHHQACFNLLKECSEGHVVQLR